MPTHIFPDDAPSVIVGKFQASQGDVIVHYRSQPYDIGPQTIKLTNTPLRIIGLDQDGKKADKLNLEAMPAIRGTAPGLLTGQNPSDCGIFFIGPGCSVEMSGLRLIHEIPSYGGARGHGSATIANLVDNIQESSLTITNCTLETNATAAINIRSDTAPKAAPANKPVNCIRISDSQVTGKTNQGIMAGNFSSISLGFWGKVPVDMRNGEFEVRGCTLNSLVFGVPVWKVLCDSHSKFLVTDNELGNLPCGVSFIFKPNQAGEPVSLPKGEISITDNTLTIGTFLDMPENMGEPKPFGAAGILVRVSSVEDGQKAKVTIRDNHIDMTHLPQASVTYKYIEGIVYELVPPVAQPNLLKSVTCHIHNNVVLQPVAAAPPVLVP